MMERRETIMLNGLSVGVSREEIILFLKIRFVPKCCVDYKDCWPMVVERAGCFIVLLVWDCRL